ncbi:MAG: FAD-binding oxidoreductase [Bacteroidetes bacterium]|nr:FAD-binding oxidoreductase [Bacteroidota bacterium]
MIDCLIIGGGISGICVAFELINMGKSFEIYNDDKLGGSSTVAAGIYNPMLPKHQKMAFNAAELYPSVGGFYSKIEKFAGSHFHFYSPINYIFNSTAEQNNWSILLETEKFAPFAKIETQKIDDYIKSPFGILSINHSGRVDTQKMIKNVYKKFNEMKVLKSTFFDESQIQHFEDFIDYQGTQFKNIIFCQGNYSSVDLKLKPAKGEILTIECHSNFNNLIPQQGIFMAPDKPNVFKIGSTFEWQNLNNTPTEKGKNEIIEKFTNWYSGSYNITEHIAGIRPASHDRRPLVGKIPNKINSFVLNGLGSKGVALGPYYAKMLVNNIYYKTPIDKEVDVKRIFI